MGRLDGFLSIPFPRKADEIVCEWSVSNSATASRLLQILSLAKTVLEIKGLFPASYYVIRL
jgi:hypothetical protein